MGRGDVGRNNNEEDDFLISAISAIHNIDTMAEACARSSLKANIYGDRHIVRGLKGNVGDIVSPVTEVYDKKEENNGMASRISRKVII